MTGLLAVMLACCCAVSNVGGGAIDKGFVDHHVRNMEESVLPYLLGDPYYFNKVKSRPTETYLSELVRQDPDAFASLEDTVFAQRPNTVEHALSLFASESTRIAYVSTIFSCFSPIDLTRRSPVNYFREYAGLPRPALVVQSDDVRAGQPVIRSWASAMEITDQPVKNLSWCLSTTPIERLGIEKEHSLSVTMPSRSPLEAFVRKLRTIENDTDQVLLAFEKQYKAAFRSEWLEDNFHLRYKTPVAQVLPEYSPQPGDNVQDYLADDATNSALGLQMRRAIAIGQQRIRKQLRSSPITGTSIVHTSNTQFAIATSSALLGTVVEDILLMKLIQHRHLESDTQYCGSSLVLALRTARFGLVIGMATLDMLPLVLIVLEGRQTSTTVLKSTKSYVSVGHPHVRYDQKGENRPAGFGFLVSVEVWTTQAKPTNRRAVGLACLVVAVILHIAVLGGHAAYQILVLR